MQTFIDVRSITINKQAVDEEHVEDFVERLEAGWKVKPILVRKISEHEHRLVDGRHRLAAQKRLGRGYVEALITL